jgi:Fe-S-cluster containining protein
MLPDRDSRLIQIVDAAMAESAQRSGARVVCRAGCNECCRGPFEISWLDAIRLQRGLAELESRDEVRASAIRQRAVEAPDDPDDDEPCPALDPITGACELYSSRPITCRAFGAPVRYLEGAVSICELNFVGATDREIAECAVEVDPDGLEMELIAEVEQTSGLTGVMSVADALRLK